MSTHFSVDRGELSVPRHLHLVTDEWPTEADTDQYERRNPVGVGGILALIMLAGYIGLVAWAVI